MTDTATDSGTKLLNAIERLIDCDDAILAGVQRRVAASRDRNEASTRTIAEYSNKTAMVGALAALPGVIPGYGTAASVTAFVAQLAYVMKTEVEMCLALAALYGLDIRRRDHRELAFLLAAVTTHEVSSGRFMLRDYGEISAQAIWAYTPREVSKLLVRVLAGIAVAHASRVVGVGLLRAVPFVGVGIGAAMNKVLTRNVGQRAHVAFATREDIIRLAGVSRPS